MKLGTVLKIVGFLVVALVVGLVAAVMSIDLNKHKKLLTEEISTMTGRELAISGDLGLSLGWNPALTADGVTLANAPWAGAEPMVAVEHMEAQVGLKSLLSGVFEIQRVVLDGARLSFETNAQGEGNWLMPALAGEGGETGGETTGDGGMAKDVTMPSLDLREVSLTNVAISFTDGQEEGGAPLTANLEELSLSSHSLEDNLSLVLKAQIMDKALEVSGQVGTLERILTGDSLPVSLRMGISGADGDSGEVLTATVDGHVTSPLEGTGVDLRYAMHAPDLEVLSDGALLSQRLDMSGHVLQDGDQWLVRDMTLRIGQSSMTGTIRVNPMVQPMTLDGSLDFPLLALEEFVPDGAADDGEGGATGATVIPSEPFALAALRDLPLTVTLPVTADRIVLPNGIPLDEVSVEIKAKPGRVGPITFASALAEGKVDGTVTLSTADGDVLALDSQINGKGVVVGDLLATAGDGSSPLRGGPTDLTVKLSGQGNSPHALAGALNGSVLVNMGAGEVDNALVDLAGGDIISQVTDLMNPFSNGGGGRTPLRCAVVNVPVTDGVVKWDRQVAVETDRMTVASTGTVALGAETLDVGVKPRPREGVGLEAGVGRITQLFRVTGTFAEPKVDVDVGSAVMEAAGAAANIGAAVATMGGSVALEDMASSLLGVEETDTAPCQTALGNKPAPKPASSTGSTTSSTVDSASEAVKGLVDSVTGEGGDAAQGAVDSIKKGLGGLFGN